MWYFVFFTFSDKALGCKSFLATLNGHMTLGWGDPDCFFLEGDRLAKRSCHLSGKSVAGVCGGGI